MGTLNCAVDMSSGTKQLQHQPAAPTSPTASFSESNIVASSADPDAIDALAGLQALRFDGDIDGEIQSPDLAMWESLFADQIGAGAASAADFLMSSPRRDFSPLRDFMASSPKRDYMVSSPKRDYMMSSPKRDYMVSSPKREMVASPRRTFSNLYNNSTSNQSYMHGTLHGMDTGSPSNLAGYGKGKSSQSPLHKGFVNNAHSNSSKSNLSCSSSYVNSSENLALPSLNSSFLEDGYLAYQLPPEKDAGGSSSAGTSATQLPTLSECLAMPEPVYGARDEAAVGRGIPVGGLQPDHLYYASQFGAADGLPLQHQMAKPDQWADSSSLHSMLGSVIQSDQAEQEQDSGLQLVHLLLACADFVSKGDQPSALRHLHLLRRVASPLGDSMQRVASYFADALATRLSVSSGTAISPRGAGAPYPFPPSPDTLKIYQILYQACPYIKFAHFTANQAIFEAFHGEDRVHVVDLDILQGYQWPAFLQALAAPKIMTLVEQEAGHNGPYFLGRFLEALHYYSAIFDSLDATFPADSAPRMKVEQCLLAPEIRNVVACEGAERVARHERLDRWRRIMEDRGFEAVPLSPAAVGQSQVLLGLYGAGDGYRLNEEKGCLLLGWQDRAIIGASAWRC
ncbi:unnamed protein product [Triticum turgidum subsp. durum]|uniref:DELLA protein n=1 Tax=Triticum turgidum subsp. durum TaxID=4567 RepID=A0A9R1PED5_TRITD|nr:unnamed protein product [Triticum turgidum subsp. durum]